MYTVGAGKTYTMLGTESDPGIMALTLNDLFQKIEDTKQDMIYRVTMAYLEVSWNCAPLITCAIILYAYSNTSKIDTK